MSSCGGHSGPVEDLCGSGLSRSGQGPTVFNEKEKELGGEISSRPLQSGVLSTVGLKVVTVLVLLQGLRTRHQPDLD